MAHVMAVLGLIDHPHAKEQDATTKPSTKHIIPQYHVWSRSGHTKGDFTEMGTEHNFAKRHHEIAIENAATPCTWDEFIDHQCRNHPQNRFAGKMTEARPGEYCDAWTLPRLEACRKAFGLDAAE